MNRSHLQAAIQFSVTSRSSELSISHPKITFTIEARLTWSARPERPLTICTRHTPLDIHVPGRDWTGVSLVTQIARLEEGTWKPLMYTSPALRYNFKNPIEEDWQQKLGFVTIPALDSGQMYVVDRDIELNSLPSEHRPILSRGEKVEFRLVDGVFSRSPGIEWWNWGHLEGDLEGKKLGYVGDPMMNDKIREEERKHLPADLVLGYENWMDFEDNEGKQMIRLEVEFNETPVSVHVVV